MILRRLGNKSRIAKSILPYFPQHNIYIEPFFGAGGMFFSKPKAKYNIVNDLDSDVFNLFMVVINRKEELEKAFYQMPVHSDLLNYWKHNKENEPIKKALRFLLLSNFGYLGKPDTLNLRIGNDKAIIYDKINLTNEALFGVQIANYHFKKFLKSIGFRKEEEKEKVFIYADPPYINTANNYDSSFTKQDSIDLFDCLQTTGCKWAMSEFDNEFILQQAKERNLQVHIIGERKNIKNRRVEVLITNYKLQNKLL